METPPSHLANAAVLVSVWLPSQSEEQHLAQTAEMQRLMQTLGLRTVAIVGQKRGALSAAAALGGGKLAELAALTGGSGVVPSGAKRKKTKAELKHEIPAAEPQVTEPVAQLIVVDNDMSPSQMRNLEQATGARVLDRSGVIIEIFHQHAHTKEARLQVELARLAYEAPRLREKVSNSDRQRGGTMGGSGETALQLDKRRIRDRLSEVRHELDAIARSEQTRRSRRVEENLVALVGYTNAGKSSLMRALTGSDVLVADKLFATLGTTVRALKPDSHPRILVSDTVGFIKNLPHDLVASFRATLDEARAASLLLFVVDASDADFRNQLAVTQEVLADIGAETHPRRLLLNKSDRLTQEQRRALQVEFPDALLLSALDANDIRLLRESVVAFFERDTVETELLVPYSAHGVLRAVRERARVMREAHEQQGTRLTIRASPRAISDLERLLGSSRAL